MDNSTTIISYQIWFLATYTQHYAQSPDQCNKTRERNKRSTDWERRSKWPLLTDEMMAYGENFNDTHTCTHFGINQQ